MIGILTKSNMKHPNFSTDFFRLLFCAPYFCVRASKLRQLKMESSVERKKEERPKEIHIRQIGPPPEDPVCDSGIYCYGKKFVFK